MKFICCCRNVANLSGQWNWFWTRSWATIWRSRILGQLDSNASVDICFGIKVSAHNHLLDESVFQFTRSRIKTIGFCSAKELGLPQRTTIYTFRIKADYCTMLFLGVCCQQFDCFSLVLIKFMQSHNKIKWFLDYVWTIAEQFFTYLVSHVVLRNRLLQFLFQNSLVAGCLQK